LSLKIIDLIIEESLNSSKKNFFTGIRYQLSQRKNELDFHDQEIT
jgi:hypothetical protein